MCQVIAITNQKGGVGKTTTTFHLGTKLAQEGKRVLLIEADPQASLTFCFGIRYADTLDTTLTNALQAIVEDEPIDPEMGIRTHEEGAKLFPANIELASFETVMINVRSREYIMREFVNIHRPNFDYILIDCMPSLGMLTVNALAAADSVIIPSQPSFLSAKGLDLLLHSVAKVKRSINPTLDISGILLTMVDDRTNNARDIATTIRASYGDAMFKEVADVQTADMLKLPVPEAHYHNVVLKPSEHQKEMVADLSTRAERVRNKMVNSSEDNMLLITNDGRKLALDQRLVNPMLPDSDTGKVTACANIVYDIWQRTTPRRSTQMVFCDRVAIRCYK